MEILPDQVRPGDLITADLINRMLTRLDALEDRVDALEGDGPGASLVVTQLIPSGTADDPIRVGQPLQLLGRNFGFSLGGHRVLFDSTPVTAFGLGSSDMQLVVTVPTSLSIPQGGRTVVLTVSNGVTSDMRTITVLPVEITLSGDVDVFWRDDIDLNPDPNPIPRPVSEAQSVRFAYRLRSRASTTASFTVNPAISVAAWQSGLQVFGADGEVVGDRRIELDPDEATDFFVQAMLTPQAGAVDAFDLNVIATAGNVTGGIERAFVFEEEVEEGDDQIELAFTDATVFALDTGGVDPSGGAFDPATNTISVAQGFRLDVTFATTFRAPARYDVTAEPSDDTSNWDLRVRAPNTGFYDESGEEPPVNEAPRFSAEPQAGASASGRVTFRIQREGESRSQTRTFNLAVFEPQ